jgi:glycosyltransferase involved in cell wall biosynthesis
MIKSLLNQTNPDWNLLICDNASTDKTFEIANVYAEKDSRINVFHFDTRKDSAFESWVRSIQYALIAYDYEYIQIIPGDDFIQNRNYTDKLRKILLLDSTSGVIPKFVYESREVCLKSINHKGLFADWNFVHLVFGVYKTKHLEQALTKLLKLNKTQNDFDWWLTYFLINKTLVYSPDLEFYRSTRLVSDVNKNQEIVSIKRTKLKSLRRVLSPLRRNYERTLIYYRHYVLLGGSITLYDRGRLFLGFLAKSLRII